MSSHSNAVPLQYAIFRPTDSIKIVTRQHCIKLRDN